MTEQSAADMARHERACHAMQSGVALEMEKLAEPTTPRHLRVGVNVALVDAGALVALLVKKGVITNEEYFKAIADAMEAEVASYEARLSLIYGTTITLG